MRQIVLDTETTGLSPQAGHRIIEIGAIELVNRRLTGKTFHYYLHPDRDIDYGAQQVHGITLAFLADKPRFHEISAEFVEFIRGAELIIHNATFDVNFLNHELKRLDKKHPSVEDLAQVTDTLSLARKKHPGQKNSLDALTKRYEINCFERDLHGALLDAQILAQVYLAMTGGQEDLTLEVAQVEKQEHTQTFEKTVQAAFRVIAASAEELASHQDYLKKIEKSSGKCAWVSD